MTRPGGTRRRAGGRWRARTRHKQPGAGGVSGCVWDLACHRRQQEQ